ncbi:MAG: trehalose-phosphatase [Parasphingopyxis sp.]|uniref:trehalose-phosphatase n=1 Tax=Parasphingopyxis sp. TaxID=1920299 RepID=UPI003FA0EE5D
MTGNGPLSLLPAPVGSLSLFLDFDGTLVPLAARPDAIDVPAGLAPLLESSAQRLDGRQLVISGRTIADLDHYLDTHALSLCGSHGLEMRIAGGGERLAAEDFDLAALLAELERYRRDQPGLEIERKRFGAALHYRQSPELADTVTAFGEEFAARHGLSVKKGKMVVELVPPGYDKGMAVKAIMREDAFAGSVPLYIGDDVTDEDGFRAARELGGTAIIVGERESENAAHRLAAPRDVHALIAAIAGAPR